MISGFKVKALQAVSGYVWLVPGSKSLMKKKEMAKLSIRYRRGERLELMAQKDGEAKRCNNLSMVKERSKGLIALWTLSGDFPQISS